MKHVLVIAASAAALLFGTIAGAAEPPAGEAPQAQSGAEIMFQALDRDQNGKIDAEEAQVYKGLKNAFPRIAKDGTLEEAEFAAWYKEFDRPSAEE